MQETEDARYEMMNGWTNEETGRQAGRQTDIYANICLGRQAQCQFTGGPRYAALLPKP